MKSFILPIVAGVVLIAIATFAVKAALDSAYEQGVSETLAVQAEAIALAQDEARKLEREAMQAEMVELKRISLARLNTANNLTKINAELRIEKKDAVERLALTIGSIPDEDWFYLHEPIGAAVSDGMRND